MEKYGSAFLAVTLSLLLVCRCEAAGFFGGAEVDDESQRFYYAGVQTGGRYFLQLFAGDLDYDFQDSGIIREATSKWITPAVGFRTEGPVSVSFLTGPTFREKKEERAAGTITVRDSGGFFQFGGFLWKQERTLEFLASYTNLDDFLWGRIRWKEQVPGGFFAGLEVFGMGNRDFDAWGGGPLLEFRKGKAAVTLKAGYKHTTTYRGGFYTGLELYTTF